MSRAPISVKLHTNSMWPVFRSGFSFHEPPKFPNTIQFSMTIVCLLVWSTPRKDLAASQSAWPMLNGLDRYSSDCFPAPFAYHGFLSILVLDTSSNAIQGSSSRLDQESLKNLGLLLAWTSDSRLSRLLGHRFRSLDTWNPRRQTS